MDVTLIKRNGCTEHIILGSISTGLEKMIEQQNNSPLETATWTIENEWTDKWISDIEEFLEFKNKW